MAANDNNFGLFALIVSVDSYFHTFDYTVRISFVKAIPAQPAKIHAQNAIFHRQIALAERYIPFIIVDYQEDFYG